METPLVIPHRSPQGIPWWLVRWVGCLLFAKTIGAVLYEYRWYFPLDFEQSAFLLKRENDFNGSYRVAFYVHLFAGPLALLSATFLMVSGLQRASRFRTWHPIVGRLQVLTVVPLSFSGMVMARNAFAGPIAGVAFCLLALFTLVTCFAAAHYAMRRDFTAHRVWATRCFLLLCSPLLLRIVGGIAIVTGTESEMVYRWNAWLSWLLPLLAYEFLRTNWRRVTHFLTLKKRCSIRVVQPTSVAQTSFKIRLPCSKEKQMTRRSGLTLVEVFIVIAIIAMLIVLLLPAQRGAREAARRNNCSNAMRQLSLSTLNYESATGRFPLAMRGGGIRDSAVDRFGPAPMSQADGYSFIVSLLPYMEETQLADDILAASNDYDEPLDSPRFLVNQTLGKNGSLWDRPVELLICPSFPGENIATGRYSAAGTPQVSNYHAMTSACVEGDNQRIADLDLRVAGIIVTQEASPKGLKIGDIKDGTSSSLLLAESRAEQWSAWFSGTSTMTVALPPDLVRREELITDQSGCLAVPSQVPSGLNYGRTVNSPNARSMFWQSKVDQRDWGPSSAHAGNVVMHAFADGHVNAMSQDMDATAYLRVATREGGDPTDLN